MSEDIKPENGSIPPRVSIKIPGQSGEVDEKSLAEAQAYGKKKTARIPLDQVTAEPGAASAASVSGVGVSSKSIRILPTVGGPGTISPLPPVGKALSGMLTPESKSQTSRIPLEFAISDKGAKVSDGVPKTIKVKRPVLAATPKVTAMPVEVPAEVPPPVAEVPAAGALSSKNQTARVDIIPEAVEPQQTQKKTIKIRRADGGAGEIKPTGRSVSIARAEGAPSEVPAQGPGVPAPHGIFVALAAAAALVLCFMLYVLAAQAYPGLGLKLGI